MGAKVSRFVPREMKSSLIHIEAYRDRNPVGYLVNPYYKERRYFKSLTQLLLMIDKLHDDINYPQREISPRAFEEPHDGVPHGGWRDERTDESAPVIASFQLRIMFRQNASWQGSLMWLDESTEANFRSALEFIGLLDSALNEKEGGG